MEESARIADQLRRAFEGGAWHGPALYELLSNVPAEQAVLRPIPGAHSIWEIVLHVAAWEEVALKRVAGRSVKLTDAEDWPPVEDESEGAWQEALGDLRSGHIRLRQAIEQLSELDLEEPVRGRDYPIYNLLHGVIQHDLYHAGQIAMLKKAEVEAGSPSTAGKP